MFDKNIRNMPGQVRVLIIITKFGKVATYNSLYTVANSNQLSKNENLQKI